MDAGIVVGVDVNTWREVMKRDRKILRKRKQRYKHAVEYIKENNLKGIIDPKLLARPLNWNFKIEVKRAF